MYLNERTHRNSTNGMDIYIYIDGVYVIELYGIYGGSEYIYMVRKEYMDLNGRWWPTRWNANVGTRAERDTLSAVCESGVPQRGRVGSQRNESNNESKFVGQINGFK